MEASDFEPTGSSSAISSDDAVVPGGISSPSEGPENGSSSARKLSFGEHQATATSHPAPTPQPTPSVNPSTKNSNTTSTDDATIQQIVRFWNHPSLQNAATEQKQAYLRQKGITQEQMFQAWDRMVEDTSSNSSMALNKSNNPTRSSDNPLLPGGGKAGPAMMPPPPSQQYQQNASTHHPYQPNNNYNNYYHPSDHQLEEDQGDIWSSATMIAAMGGMLGLLAAATVRWLNGGDFMLFPPPTRHNASKSTTLTLQEQQSTEHDNGVDLPPVMEQEEMEGGEVSEEEEELIDDAGNLILSYVEDEDREVSHYLSSFTDNKIDETLPLKEGPDVLMMAQIMAQFAVLGDTMKQQTSVQQRLLQKLSATPNVTDQSMNILRRQQQEKQGSPTLSSDKMEKYAAARPYVGYKLSTIQSELESLKQEMTALQTPSKEGSNVTPSFQDPLKLELQLTETLQQLQGLLRDLEEQKKKNIEQGDKPSGTGVEDDGVMKIAAAVALPGEDSRSKDSSTAPPTVAVDVPFDKSIEDVQPTAAVEPDLSNEQHLISLRQALTHMVQDNDDRTNLRTGAQILFLYMNNLANHPHLPRYRKIHKTNESFQKVKTLKGIDFFLEAVGFVDKGNLWDWEPKSGADKNGATTDKTKCVDNLFLREAVKALTVLKSIPPQPSDGSYALSLLDSVLEKLPLPSEPELAPPSRSYATVVGSSSPVGTSSIAESNSPEESDLDQASMQPTRAQDESLVKSEEADNAPLSQKSRNRIGT